MSNSKKISELPIIPGGVYTANIKNFNFKTLKVRPIVVLKVSINKVLALQITSSEHFVNPKNDRLDTEIQVWSKENNIKGYSFETSHWMRKKDLAYEYKNRNRHVLTPKETRRKMIAKLKTIRRAQIIKKEERIIKYLKIHLKTKKSNTEHYKLAHNELKWIIKHNLYLKNKYSKITDQKKYLNKLILSL